MHPFFPVVAMVFNTMGFAMTWYLYLHVLPDPILREHRDMFEVPIGFAFVFGIPLVLWLAKRKMFYPLVVAVLQGGVTWFLIQRG
jgi:ABC-type proline/glycine betaine transport system permease subunit